MMEPLERLYHVGEFCHWPNPGISGETQRAPRPIFRRKKKPHQTYDELKAAGVCTRCKRQPARPKKTRCDDCASVDADWQARHIEKMRASW